MQVAPRRQLEIAERCRDRLRTAPASPVRLIGAWARVLNGSSSNSRCAGRAVLRGRGDAGDRGQHFFGDDRDDVLDLAAAVGCEQRRKAAILQVAAEQGANPRPGDAKRVAGGCIVGQHEDVAEQSAHRARLDLAAVRRPRVAALVIPIGEELAARRMFHARPCPGARLGGTVLSRFCARAFPCLLCRRGFAASMPRARFRASAAALRR